MEQHHLTDLGDDLLDVVSDQHDGGSLVGQAPDRVEKPVPRDEVEPGGRLVEHERARPADEGARDQHTAGFPGGHLVKPLGSQVARLHPFERDTCLLSHWVRDVHVQQHTLSREEPRDDGFRAR